MERQIASYRAVCSQMNELDTINALAEWWENILFKSEDTDEVRPEYFQLREKLSGKTIEEIKKDKEDGDYDEDEVYWNAWDKPDQEKGPDRCTKGHGLHRCQETPILVLDQEE